MLQEGRDVGIIRPEVDLSVARVILQGSIAWTIEWYRQDGRKISEIADQIADTMLYGVAVVR